MLLDHVTRVVLDVTGPHSCTVVGGDDVVKHLAISAGADWAPDPGKDLNYALWTTMQSAYTSGATATLYLPGDLPLISPHDVLSIANASDGYTRPVGNRASSDGGTNALLQPASAAFKPLLGPDSFANHRAAAHVNGSDLQVLDLPGLSFDLDSIADFQWATDNIHGFPANLHDWQVWLYTDHVGPPPRTRR
jgi:2-phospho-L-lactate guanylyltransferase